MRKMATTLAFLSFFFLQAGCTSLGEHEKSHVPDDITRIFVGTWKGTHMNKNGELERTWVQKRLVDGTYSIVFFHHTEKGVFSSKQKGDWWIEGDRFFENTTDDRENPYEYEFEIISKDEIHFSSVVNDYEFTDKKIEALEHPQFI